MPSNEVYQSLLKNGIRVDKDPYNRFDTLAGESDLTNLFEVLSAVKDFKGNSPVITANTVVANPDFEKIKACGFQEYHYELFTESLKRYPGCANSFKLWQDGINNKLFFPQYHGREHLNVSRWMKNLKDNSYETRLSFDLGLYGISTTITNENRASYMAAMDYDDLVEKESLKSITTDGLRIFKNIFGYNSESFIAPNYTWGSYLESTLFDAGVKYIQGIRIQYEPAPPRIKKKAKIHFIGQHNNNNQIYIIRNCFFEPALSHFEDSVDKCLNEIAFSFKWHKPAVIGSHRLNYIGSLVESNRYKNLDSLRLLLREIKKTWKDVEFITTPELGNIINNNNS
jgi:hypothetical protein